MLYLSSSAQASGVVEDVDESSLHLPTAAINGRYSFLRYSSPFLLYAAVLAGLLTAVGFFWAGGEYGQRLIAATAASGLFVARAAEGSDRGFVV